MVIPLRPIVIAALVAVTLPMPHRTSAEPNDPSVSRSRFHLHGDEKGIDSWIAMRPTERTQAVIPVVLNGHAMNALLDTGANVTGVDATVAAKLGLKPYARDTISVIGGDRTAGVSFAPLDTLRFGGWTQTGGRIAIIDMSGIGAVSGQPVEMLIGADLLRYFAITFDFDHNRVKLRHSGASSDLTGASVPLSLSATELYLLDAAIDGRETGPFYIDTGNDSELAISKAAWPNLLDSGERATTIASMGLGGIVVNPHVRVHRVALGTAISHQVPADLSDKVQPNTVGSIGLGLLSRFNVFLDVGTGRMILATRATLPKVAPVSHSGVQGSFADDGETVLHVMAGSPAEQAGMKAGDRICTIGGQRVTQATEATPLADWGRGPIGSKVLLSLCDGRMKILKLKEFY